MLFADCIRTAAKGEKSPPEICMPNFDDLRSQFFCIVGAVVLYLCPALIYYLFTEQMDRTFWILLGTGVFFFPMALLAVIMFDSATGLNPLILIGSIKDTFLRYCLLIIIYYSLLAAFIYFDYLLASFFLWKYLSMIPQLYFLFVSAALLGAFFHRCEEKLYWEV